MLQQLAKRLLESALEVEITVHLSCDKHDPASRGTANSRNGTRFMTVLTDIGPAAVAVPQDRGASFQPKTAAKRQRRLGVVDKMMISLGAGRSSVAVSCESWDAPFVVTTAVQLFGRKPRQSRKLRRLANAVVVLDEVQALPLPLLVPILDALQVLSRHFGTTVLLASATQPSFDHLAV
ncbi:transposase [Lentzea sp. NEAU-D7]|uniref:transposase n=1 Tax=Lentzea sp. NEAU-D7 TaxID=2994667 RepID=UPI003A4C545E